MYVDHAKAPRRTGPHLAIVALFMGVAFTALSGWDEEAFERVKGEARQARSRAIQMAVEDSEYRPFLLTDKHCRVPAKGERLVMQHAEARDTGDGFRCTYYSNLKGANWGGVVKKIEWSRSPEEKVVSYEPTVIRK